MTINIERITYKDLEEGMRILVEEEALYETTDEEKGRPSVIQKWNEDTDEIFVLTYTTQKKEGFNVSHGDVFNSGKESFTNNIEYIISILDIIELDWIPNAR